MAVMQHRCPLQTIRLALFFLLSGTVVVVFYGVTTSGVGSSYQHRSMIQPNLPTTLNAGSAKQPTKNNSFGHVMIRQPIETDGIGHVVVRQPIEYDKKTSLSNPLKVIKDKNGIGPHLEYFRELDISESEPCDDRCQQNIQRFRHKGVTRTCADQTIVRRRPSLWDQNGNLRRGQLMRLNHLFPVDGSKMIYCSVPKDGCSVWKRLLLKAAGYDPDKFPRNIHPFFEQTIKPLSAYNVTEAERRLRTYNKFLFVRDPLDRMLSLFLDKAVAKHDFPFNRTQFGEFLEHIISQPIHGRTMGYAEHWTHASYLCLPCEVNYTFIGRLETSKRDTNFVFNKFFNSSVGKLSMPTKIHKTSSSEPGVKESFFNQVNRFLLETVYYYYRLDYFMFSYPKPRISKPAAKGGRKEHVRTSR